MIKPTVKSKEEEFIEFVHAWIGLCVSGEKRKAFETLDPAIDSDVNSWGFEELSTFIDSNFSDIDRSKFINESALHKDIKTYVHRYMESDHSAYSGWYVSYDIPVINGSSKFRVECYFVNVKGEIKFNLDEVLPIKTAFQFIDKESELALQELANGYMQFLFSPSSNVDFGSSIVTVGSISIPIGKKKYLVLDKDWSGMALKSDSCSPIRGRVLDSPKGISSIHSEDGRSYLADHFTYHIGRQKKISRVIVLQGVTEDDTSSEEILCINVDYGIAIEFDDNARIEILMDQSYLGDLKIDCCPAADDVLKSNFAERVEFPHNKAMYGINP